MTQPETPLLPSGNILQSASHVIITGGSFLGSQSNVTTTVNEPNRSLDLLYEKAAPNAILNAGGRADTVRCFPGTREEVLAKIEAWIGSANEFNDHGGGLFWLSGPAGAGKSAIVQTLAERCMARGLPMANFFFFRGDYTRSHARPLVATLVRQLLESYPNLKPPIGAALVEKPMIFTQALHDQFKHLIQNPVRAIREVSVDRWPIVILIDGLDECDSAGKFEQKVLLHDLVSRENSLFIVLVASRPEPHLIMTFNEIGSCAESIFLDKDYRPSDDIRLFVVAELTRMKIIHHLGRTVDELWPSESNINAIVDKSSGQFIYAATVLRFIAKLSASPTHSLDKVLSLRPVKKSSPFAQLDAIYTYILSQVEDWEAAKDVLSAQILILTVSTWEHPHLRFSGLHRILAPYGYEAGDLASCTSDLTAIARFDHKRNQLEFYHASLSDFLCDSTRSGEYYTDINAFTMKLAPTHINGIWDYDSLQTSIYVVRYVEQPTSSISEALISSCPPLFEWPTTELDFHPFVNWFLEAIQGLYFHRNNQLCQLILRKWLIWFRDMKLVLQDEDFRSVEFANAIWKEITSPKVDLVETPLTARMRTKKAALWKRILRAT